MSTSNKTVYFLTGANRGIGFEFAKKLSSLEDTFLIATARDPQKATELNELASKTGNIKVIALDASSEESISTIGTQLETLAPYGVDYFISNAGIALASAYDPVIKVPKSVWIDHYTTNTIGPILLTQQLYPHLLKKQTRKIHFVSSQVGSIGGFLPVSVSAYGQSKAALNYTINTLALELGPEGFIIIAVHPGLVKTSMGNAGVSFFKDKDAEFAKSMEDGMIEVADTAAQQVELMQKVTREDNGKFFNYDGSIAEW